MHDVTICKHVSSVGYLVLDFIDGHFSLGVPSVLQQDALCSVIKHVQKQLHSGPALSSRKRMIVLKN